ncbi:MAG: hypothetical protein WC895_01100 [Candidatus Shapirobacteria bacterium]|jgi:hypothetical protein
MKRNNFFKVVGLMGALFLVAFGNINNFLRTIKLGWQKIDKQK